MAACRAPGSARWADEPRRYRTRTGALRLAGTFLRVGVMNEMQYRINFFLQLIQSLLTVGTGLVVLAVVFSQDRRARRLEHGRSCWR